jgi:hypothetical protein
MKRIPKMVVLVVVVAGCLPASALAASSPTVITGATTKVSDTGATLEGRVNPNGAQTGYVFDYGTTTALGSTSKSKSAGHGNKGVDITTAISALTPGTTYYYRLSAVSSAGAANGAIRHFSTTGHLPPAVVTGAAINVRKTMATPTGLINANGAQTTWQVQWGLSAPNPASPSYPFQTPAVPLSPLVAAPLPVSVVLNGLAPATLFHYRIVAFHDNAVSAGADATFFTEPDHRPVPRFSPHTSPGTVKKSPYTFTTTGTLAGASFIPAVDRCTGNVTVRFTNGRKQVARTVAPVGGDCRFSAATTFKKSGSRGAVRLKVSVSFGGNGYIAPVSKPNAVTAG